MSATLTAALRAIPGYKAARDRVEFARRWHEQIGFPAAASDVRRTLAAEVTEAARAQQPFPVGISRRLVVDLELAAKVAFEDRQLAKDAFLRLEDEAKSVVLDGIEHAYSKLRDLLGGIILEAREIGDGLLVLDLSPREAQHRDKGELWDRADEVVGRYLELNDAYLTLALKETGPNSEAVTTAIAHCGQDAQHIERAPKWTFKRTTSPIASKVKDMTSLAEHRTWLKEPAGSRFLPQSDGTAGRHLVDTEATGQLWLRHISDGIPWILRPADALALYALAERAVRPIDSQPAIAMAVEARANHQRLVEDLLRTASPEVLLKPRLITA